MREAKIILSTDCGYTAHKLLRLYLARHFGGYTATNSDGGWVDSDDNLVQERVTVYEVAMEPTVENSERLLEYAAAIGKGTGQDCVYVKLPFGNVRLISAKEVSASDLPMIYDDDDAECNGWR